MYLNSFFSCKGLDNICSCSVGVGNFVGSIGDMKIEEDCPTACRPTDHQAYRIRIRQKRRQRSSLLVGKGNWMPHWPQDDLKKRMNWTKIFGKINGLEIFSSLIILFISSMHYKSLVRHTKEKIPSANQFRRHLSLLLCDSSSMPPGLDTVLTSRRKEPRTIRPGNSADQLKNRTRTIRPWPSSWPAREKSNVPPGLDPVLTSQRKEPCTTRTGPRCWPA